MGSMEHLHFGEHETEVIGVPTGPTAIGLVKVGRQSQGRAFQVRCDAGLPGLSQGVGVNADP